MWFHIEHMQGVNVMPVSITAVSPWLTARIMKYQWVISHRLHSSHTTRKVSENIPYAASLPGYMGILGFIPHKL